MKAKSLIVISFIVLGSCNSEKANNDKKVNTLEKNNILIFVDKSISVDVNKTFITNKFQQALTKAVEENITKAGDKLEMYYIHENTAKGRCLSIICRTKQESTEGLSATDEEAMKVNYDLLIQNERGIILKQAFKYLMAENNDLSNRQTDIWASLPIIAKTLQEPGTVKVYYFSDMVESMPGINRRDFHVRPPKNNEEATQWSNSDAEKMKNVHLKNAEITLILPFDPMSSTKENSPFITAYWTNLFEKLGIKNITEL